ncbi:MAG: DUF6173 family protein [Pseudoalteromonas distincta]|uniref:DUF6173 family protein n=1 Tax=Pseudoalteromonas distincta TaxID=77608 RepID=UPI0030039E7C
MNPLDPFNMNTNSRIQDAMFESRAQVIQNPNLASEFHNRLITWINDFHRDLDDEHEVGAQLVNFGQSITFHIEDIGCWNPSLISFIGKNEKGETIKLVQHVSQISILLVGLKRNNLEQPKRPIGFASWEVYETEMKD